MSKNRVYLGNIPFTSSSDDLKAFLSPFEVTSVDIITDRDTKRPKGFAFAELKNADDMAAVIKQCDQQQLGGRSVVVNAAKEKTERRQSSNGKNDYAKSWQNDRAR